MIKLKENADTCSFIDDNDYARYYNSIFSDSDFMQYSNKITADLGNSVVYNDYEDFINRSVYIAKGKIKK